MENESDLQKAKSEVYVLFAALITIGVFAAMIAAFVWLYWLGVWSQIYFLSAPSEALCFGILNVWLIQTEEYHVKKFRKS